MYELVFIFFVAQLPDEELIQHEYVIDYQFKEKAGCRASTWPAFNSDEVQEYYLDLGGDLANAGINRECRFVAFWKGWRHRNFGGSGGGE